MGFRSHTLHELAELLGGEVAGDGETVISGVAGIMDAQEGDLTFVANPKYVESLKTTRASAVIRKREVQSTLPSIILEDPYLGFTRAMTLIVGPSVPECEEGIHDTAIVDPSAEVGENVTVGAFCQVGRGAKIGANTKILFGTWIGDHVVVGRDVLVYPNVVIRERCEVGNRVILHPGVVVGSDGFGFARDGECHVKVPQIGKVVIEDDVEIGSNTTIDRATMGVTRVCQGTKVDNLVQIAHNCVVGKNSILAGQVGISGSTELGEGVVAGGQAGFVGHLEVGDHVVVGAKTGVVKSAPAGTTLLGFPGRDHGLAKKIYAYSARLPELYKRIRELEKKIDQLEKGILNGKTAKNDR
ncbi:MAG: UDP-3-O-(3-hydroxymyristoyl)glucosamine N-acyltransferase [Candidatus Latescibacterota bacterium]|nr:MAG: UDP-3-O-(3-hydroxymyristoyl)glucosamine N-acyltransferase [Candidatus Latescibacterota bacterium]